jgi:hypothetical protein
MGIARLLPEGLFARTAGFGTELRFVETDRTDAGSTTYGKIPYRNARRRDPPIG